MASEPWPDFYVVGCRKGGTTSLYEYCLQHPDIFVPPEVKAPRFFLRKGDTMVGTDGVERDEAAYLDLYRDAPEDTPRGDMTEGYLHDANAAERIAKVRPDAKIVIILRDPVDRGYANYLMYLRNNVPQPDWEQVVEEELACVGRGEPTPYDHVGEGFYAEQVERYLARFPRQQILVLPFQMLGDQPKRFLARFADFLDVDPGRFPEPIPHNAYRKPRSRFAAWLINNERAVRFAKLFLSVKTLEKIGSKTLWTNKKPAMEPMVEKRLREAYEPDLQRLEEMLGTQVPGLRP